MIVDWTTFVNATAPNEVTDPERLYSWGTTNAGVTFPVEVPTHVTGVLEHESGALTQSS